MKRIIDTNVPIVANGTESPQASLLCQKACVAVLRRLMEGAEFQLVLDASWEVIREYQNKLRTNQNRGLGDRFLNWVLTNRLNPKKCVLVKINPRQTDTTNTFEEFPNDPDLASFDPSDQKWIALAFAGYLTYKEIIPIIQAVDAAKWRAFVTTLKHYNIEIDFICENPDTQLSEVSEREKTRRSRAKKKQT